MSEIFDKFIIVRYFEKEIESWFFYQLRDDSGKNDFTCLNILIKINMLISYLFHENLKNTFQKRYFSFSILRLSKLKILNIDYN